MVPDAFRNGGPDRNTTGPRHFWSYVSQVLDRFDRLLPFALFPLLSTLLDTRRVRRALDPSPGNYSINVEFAFPSPLVDLWQLASTPEAHSHPQSGIGSGGSDVTVDTPIPIDVAGPVDGGVGILAGAFGLLVVYALGFAAIQAVYVGGLDRRLRGRSIAPVALVRRYAPTFFVYTVVVFGATLSMVPVALVSPGLLLLSFPLIIVIGYFFYATPFLFVVEDVGVAEGLRRSYGYAVAGGAYLRFALWHAAVTAVGSLGLSILVNGGPGGFLLALAPASAFALVLTAATVAFVQELSQERARRESTY